MSRQSARTGVGGRLRLCYGIPHLPLGHLHDRSVGRFYTLGEIMKLLHASVFALGLFLNISVAVAQSCPQPSYAQIPSNKQYVKQALIDATNHLARMREISYLGSLPAPVVQIVLTSQRQAIENEYIARKAEIDNLGSPTAGFLRPRTRNFLHTVLNTVNMGIAGTSVTGGTQAVAEANSAAANAAVSQALDKLWKCF